MRKTSRIKVTEADLREQIRTLCKLFGWRMQFTWSSIHSPAGFPDLVLVNPEQKRIIFAELKSEVGKMSEQQIEWMKALVDAGAAYYTWRPADIETIAEILK